MNFPSFEGQLVTSVCANLSHRATSVCANPSHRVNHGAKPRLHASRANACWFPTIGPVANNSAAAAIAAMLRVMVVFDFIISTLLPRL